MSCQIEQIADCGDISCLGRSLYIQDKNDTNWLNQCSVSLTSCGSLLAVGYKNRLCLLTTQWISSTNSNTYLITWSGTLSSDITSLLAVPVSPTTQSSQNGSDWFCIIVGFKNGSVGFYTNTGHLLLLEKLDDKPVQKITCHTGAYGTLPDDIYLLFQNSECVISGSSLFQTLRYSKVQLARVQAGVQSDYSVDGRSIQIKKWTFGDQDIINDSVVVGLELKNTYDHLLTASAYGGYDTWYRSIPPHNTLVLGVGARPYVAFHYALEGGITPPLQDVARVVANKIKSALPGWLGGGGAVDNTSPSEMRTRAEPLSMRSGLCDLQRHGASVVLSPDRRLAAVADNLGRVAVLDVARGHLIRLFKGYRDAQCAFIQIFEQDNNKKLQLSTIKEIRRALLLVIYNPKKGLIDIRLMQRGNRVAVFTATKNGKLLYNTSGLLGAEQSYVQRKVNLPEHQCVLIDPDGKLKRFTIPFYFALEGEHSQRSKDLHILREMKEFVKKTTDKNEEFVDELMKRVTSLKTIDLKKQCLEMLIRNYEIPPKIIMSCVEIFWDSLGSNEVEEPIVLKCKTYYKNLTLITLFYRRINNESTNDMSNLMEKIHPENETCIMPDEKLEKTLDTFELFANDILILDRLLSLAQEKDYKDHHVKVSFADNIYKGYKEFITSFELDQVCINLCLKSSLSSDKLSVIAGDIFETFFKLKNTEKITSYMKESEINVKDLVRLIIIHFMNMPLEEISIELIKRFISILYYLCKASKDATSIVYNEISLWWQNIRDLLVDMPCPLRSMIIAMACRVVVIQFEQRRSIGEDEAWESVTKENAKWSILIGKLEDISILSIILFFKETFKGKSLPKLQMSSLEINLKFIYTRGKGSVSELISKWLCRMGVIPEAIIANELILKDKINIEHTEEEDSSEQLFLDENRLYVDENPKIFKWLAYLKKQFPFSTSADNIIGNMCWEYATAWQNDRQDMEKLAAVISCLKTLRDVHLSLGLCTIIWITHIRDIFEMSCRLVNKTGRLPKERLCFQDVGLSDVKLVKFLELSTQYLNYFSVCALESTNSEKCKFEFEKIWDDSMPALVEVAQDTKSVNCDVLNVNYQMSCALYYQCYFNLKVSKPLNTLFDIEVHSVFENISSDQNDSNQFVNKATESKLRPPRMKFLSKVVFAALELIICEGSDTTQKQYQTSEFTQWMEKIYILADLWNIDNDFLGKQQVIGLYQLGHDSLALEMVREIREASTLIAPLVGVAGARLKRWLGHAAHPSEYLAALPPNLVSHLDTIKSDSMVAANVTLQSTALVLQHVISAIEKSDVSNTHAQIIRLAELMVNGCEILEQLDA